MIIDCHAHLASRSVLPDGFFHAWTGTLKRTLPLDLNAEQSRRLDELFLGLVDDEDGSRLLEEMDQAGIDKSVLLVIDFGLTEGEEGWGMERLEAIHRRHAELAARSQGRLIPFAGVDPRRGRAGLAFFEKAVREWGFKGLKVYPPCGFSPSDTRLFPFYEICAQARLPVLAHTGPTAANMSFRYSQAMEIDEAARLFPGVNFILGHAGASLQQEAGLLAQFRPNIYLDISGFQGELHDGSFAGLLKRHLSKGLGRRLLFGTDWPIHRFFGSQAKWVQSLRGLQESGAISPRDAENLLGGNFQQLLDLR